MQDVKQRISLAYAAHISGFWWDVSGCWRMNRLAWISTTREEGCVIAAAGDAVANQLYTTRVDDATVRLCACTLDRKTY